MYNYSKIMDDCICIVHQCNSGNLSWVLFLQCTPIELNKVAVIVTYIISYCSCYKLITLKIEWLFYSPIWIISVALIMYGLAQRKLEVAMDTILAKLILNPMHTLWVPGRGWGWLAKGDESLHLQSERNQFSDLF